MPPLTVQVDEYSLYVSTRTPKGQGPIFAPLGPVARAGVSVTSRPDYDEYTRLVRANPALALIAGAATPIAPALFDAPNGEEETLLLGVDNKNLDHTTFQTLLQSGTILTALGGALFKRRPDPAYRAVVQAGVEFTTSAQARAFDLWGNPLTWTLQVRTTGSQNAAPPPVGQAGTHSLSEDVASPSSFTLAAIDQGGGIGDFQMVTPPVADIFFTFNPATGGVSWHPNGRFEALKFGQQATRTFVWRPTSSAGVPGLPVTETLVITGVNDAPSANGGVTPIAGNAASVQFNLAYSDLEGDALFNGTAFEITSPLENSVGATTGIGTLTLVNDRTGQMLFEALGLYTAVPDNEVRDLTFAFRVRDIDGLWSDPMDHVIRVVGVVGNNPPVMLNGVANIAAGAQVDIDLEALASDADSDIIGFAIAAQPIKGVVQLRAGATKSTGTLRFISGTAFNDLLPGSSQSVTVGIEVYDSRDNTDTALIDIQVSRAPAPQSPPAVNGASFQVNFNGTLTGQLTATDPDGDVAPNGWVLATAPAQGIFTLNANGSFTFNPNAQFNDLLFGQSRTVTAFVTVADLGARVSPPQGILITVNRNTQSGSPPVVVSRTTQADYLDATITGNLSAQTTDPDGDVNPNGYTLVTAPVLPVGATFSLSANGFWIITTNNVFAGFTPGQTQAVFFDWRAADFGGNPSPIARRTINVNRQASAPNSAPVASDYAISVNKNATITNASVPAATDADGNLNASGYAIFGATLNPAIDGVLTFRANGTFDFDPAGLFDDLYATPTLQSAVRTVQYTASDAGGLVSTPKTITITINGVGAMPAAPMYPMAATAAIELLWPWENVSMGRFMALPTAYPATKTTAQSGPFNDTTTWTGGVVPIAGDSWRVAFGHTVTYNQSLFATETDNPLYNYVHVDGTLIFNPNSSARLRCDTLISQYGGHYEMKPANAGVIHELLIEGAADIDISKDPNLIGRGAVWHGTTDIQGTFKDGHVLADLGALPTAGATAITLERAPVGWAVGDRIVIPGTDLQRTAGSFLPINFEHDVVTITALAGAVVTFTPALANSKAGLETAATPISDYCDETPGLGGDQPQLAVINLTRNVRFRTRQGAATPIQRRGHTMFMHRTTGAGVVCKQAQFTDMGRTNKRRIAGVPAQWVLDNGSIAADANLKGRYAVHFHWIGYDPVTGETSKNSPALLENCAFENSPGWHAAHHRGAVNMLDNVGLDAFALLVSETGDETGEWGGNISIVGRARRSGALGDTGDVVGVKDGRFTNRHDHGASGGGFHLMSRLIRMRPSDWATDNKKWNRAYGCEGYGAVWMHRLGASGAAGAQQGGYASLTKSWGPHHYNADDGEFPELTHYNPYSDIGDHPLRVTGLQITGARHGVEVVKSLAEQGHGRRSVFTDIIITGVERAVQLQYVKGYTWRRSLITGSRRFTPRDVGVAVTQNAFDIAFLDIIIGNFTSAFEIQHLSTVAPPEPNAGFWQTLMENIKFGTAGHASIPNNTVGDYPTYIPSRTGQNGIAGIEDRLFGMTLNGVTYAAAPNAKDTFAYDMRWYRTGATTPEPTVEWTFAHRNFEWRGTITDKYGIKDEPNFYGPNGFLAARSSQHGDVFWWNEDRMKLTLLAKGYWRTSSGGPAYVEGWYILTPRSEDMPRLIPVRIFLAADVPGVNAAAGAFSNGVNFTFNGVRP